jgi:hypothetical protein
MEKKTIWIMVLIIVTFSLNAQEMFYYYKGQKIDLKEDKTCVNVIINGDGIQNVSF